MVERIYTGAIETITVEVSDKRLVAEVSDPGSEHIPPVGSKVRLSFSPSSLSVVKIT